MTTDQPKPRLGAHVEATGVRFAAFTDAARCAVQLVDDAWHVVSTLEMQPCGDGYFQLLTPAAKRGSLYFFLVDGQRLPDPYARYLPQGVHGPAQVVASGYAFKHLPPARPLRDQVIYELHIGTFTEFGTFEAARDRLPALVELGVTTVELMPVAAFAGERGWGYDGVALFAPHAAYGTPDQLRELIDAAHGLGLGMILDVVYNHFGPSGNYLGAYSSRHFSEEFSNAWGKAPNFSEPALRQLVLDNARYWLREFAFDGLRLDATHAIVDASPQHILGELVKVARELSPAQLLIAEDDRNLAELVTVSGLDALWADDFHHQVRVTLSGERAGYYAAYEPSAQGVADVINRGWLYVGQPHPLSGKPRGTSPGDLSAEALVYCIQNHDQIGNRALGDRLHAVAGYDAFRAASLLLLFLPATPLLFMGQEWAASTPFLYFTDHDAELGAQVREGRRREFAAFPEFADESAREQIPDPQAITTFEASKLKWSERALPEHRDTLELYRAALALRRTDPVLSSSGRAELLAEAFGDLLLVYRWHGQQCRVVAFNFGRQRVPQADLTSRLRIAATEILLQSCADLGDGLPANNAILLAGTGNLTELVEAKND
jgi:maltooligosyltrehalose trehalohydrolase